MRVPPPQPESQGPDPPDTQGLCQSASPGPARVGGTPPGLGGFCGGGVTMTYCSGGYCYSTVIQSLSKSPPDTSSWHPRGAGVGPQHLGSGSW